MRGVNVLEHAVRVTGQGPGRVMTRNQYLAEGFALEVLSTLIPVS